MPPGCLILQVFSHEQQSSLAAEPLVLRLYHGSMSQCWHSILRSGLQTLSGGPHQAHGAARGAGIYFGRSFSTSFTYSSGGTSRLSMMSGLPGGQRDRRYTCVLACAVRPGAHANVLDSMVVCSDASQVLITHLILIPAAS